MKLNEIKIAKVTIIVIFVALVRMIAECFRLQHYSTTNLSFDQIKPFLIGTLICSISTFSMAILFFYQKYKTIISISILTIISLLVVRNIYLVH